MRILIGPGMVPKELGGKFSGGASLVVWEIAKCLANDGYEVFMFTYHDFGAKKVCGVNVVEFRKIRLLGKLLPKALSKLNKTKKIFDKYLYKKRFRSSLKLSYISAYVDSLMSQIKPDIVHIHGHFLSISSIILTVLKRTRKLIVTSHGLSSFDKSISAEYDIAKQESDIFKFLKKEKITVTVVSDELKDKLVSRFGYYSYLIDIITNGVDNQYVFNKINKTEAREKLSFPENKKIILTVGSLIKRKNQALVIKTLRYLPDDFVYVLAGEGSNKENLFELVNSERVLDRVFFLGHLEKESLRYAYFASDVFALTSYSEGQSLALLDAIASGVPIVTMEGLEGIKSLLKYPLVLSKEYTESAIAESILKALKHSNGNEKRTFTELFWENKVKEYEKLYQKIILKY